MCATGQEPRVHTIGARIAGRYLVHPPLVSKPSPLLVGFHGYGESAEHHLRELAKLPGADEWRLVSVQALSRFYARKTGAVVGSWMTSQDRDQMITDNVAYIDSVVATVTHQYETTETLVYSGFSQGVAMAYRAAILGNRPATGVIALAGDVPPELRELGGTDWPPVLVGRGTEDTYYTQDKMDVDISFLEAKAALFERVVFDGGHAWHDDFRTAAGRLLARARP